MKHLVHLAVCVLVSLTLTACFGSRNAQRTPGTRYAPFETGRIFYDDVGEDEPAALVLVHGWSADMSVWSENLGELSASIRTIAIDLPGHGESRGPARGYSMEYLARAVHAVIENAGVEFPILVGHSSGTSVIRQYYRMYPEKVAGLIVVDGALQQTMTPAMLDDFVTLMQGKNSRQAILDHIEGMLLEDMDPELKEQLIDTMLSTPRTVQIDSLRSAASPGIFGDDPIEVPLLLVLSDADPSWSRSYENYVRLIAPQVEYQKLRGVGHFLMMDAPERFNETVIEFLQDEGLR